jgi:hypothetical protein
MPQLHDRLGAGEAILLPLENDSRRFGLLAVGMPSDAGTAPARFRSATCRRFHLALEISRLRQREEFERDIRDLLDIYQQPAHRSISRAPSSRLRGDDPALRGRPERSGCMTASRDRSCRTRPRMSYLGDH